MRAQSRVAEIVREPFHALPEPFLRRRLSGDAFLEGAAERGAEGNLGHGSGE